MTTFDQRGQKVNKQTNIGGNVYKAGRDLHVAGGDINFAAASSQAEVLELLRRFLEKLAQAGEKREVAAEAVIDAEAPLKKPSSKPKRSSPTNPNSSNTSARPKPYCWMQPPHPAPPSPWPKSCPKPTPPSKDSSDDRLRPGKSACEKAG